MLRSVILASFFAAANGQDVAPPDACLVCGDGQVVTAPDAIFSLPGQPNITCGVLQTAVLSGLYPPDLCGFLPDLINPTCICGIGDLPVDPTPAPVAAPTTTPTSTPANDVSVLTPAPAANPTPAPATDPTPAPAANPTLAPAVTPTPAPIADSPRPSPAPNVSSGRRLSCILSFVLLCLSTTIWQVNPRF